MEPTRSVRPFEVISEYTPSGDQPAAIAELAAPHQRGRDRCRAARRHRNRQVGDDGLAHRAGAAPDPRARAQQDPRRAARQRVPRTHAEQRRRVLRLLLRLLPARGLRPADRHLHREGLARSTPRSSGCGTPPPTRCSAGATSIVVSTVSCIYGLGSARGVPRGHGRAAGRHAASTATRSSASSSSMQYQRNDVDFSRGKFRVRGDTIEIIPVYEEHAIRIEMFGDEIEALYSLHPLTGDVVKKLDAVSVFPGSHYVASTGRDAARDRHDQGGARGAARASSSARASCSRRSGCACARPSTSR